MAKKNPYRFNLQFDCNDANHREVVEILTEEGRRRAQFVVNAILHYKYCENSANIGIDQNKLLLRRIEEVVKTTVENSLKKVQLKAVQAPEQKKPLRCSAEISMEDVEIDGKDAESVMRSLGSFLEK